MKNQLARKFNFFLRNLVQRIDFAVVNNGHIQAIIDGLVHEHAVQHPASIDGESERNVADAENGMYFRQLLLNAAHGFQRFFAGGTVLILAGGDRQGERVEDEIDGTDAIFLGGQLEDALGDGYFLVGGKRHAGFVNGERDDGGAVALGHGQHGGSTLLAILKIDGINNRLARDALQPLFDDVGFGGVNQNGRGHAGGDFLQHLRDVSLFIFADDGAAQVEHVRAFVDQLLGQRQDVVVFAAAHQIFEMLNPGGGVHFFGHDQRLGIEVKRNRGIGAGSCRPGRDLAHRRSEIAASFHNRLDVVGRGAAAAPHHPHPVLFNEALVILRQLLRRELVYRMATFVLRQSGIGQNGDVAGGVVGEITHGVIHLARAGGAVQADDIHIEGLQRGERRADLGSQQHGSGGFQGDLHGHRQALAGKLHGVENCSQGGFGLQDVLAGFDQKNVHTAFNHGRDLLEV